MTDERGFEGLEGFELTEAIKRGFAQEQIEVPTAVQREGIVAILAGKQAVLHSGTGTGKTLAYLLPVMQRLGDPSTGRTVVMTPATELAMQIARTANLYKEEALNAARSATALVAGALRDVPVQTIWPRSRSRNRCRSSCGCARR